MFMARSLLNTNLMIRNNMKLQRYYQIVAADLSSPREELLNVVTHAMGLLLAIGGTSYLLVKIFLQTLHWSLVTGGLAFGVSLILVYLTSTLYHAANKPRLRRVFNTLDHIAIYFLIAGTYTPFILLFVSTFSGYGVLIGLWSVALVGLVYKIFATGKHKFISTMLYLAMGWAALLIIRPMIALVPGEILAWILAGGICYTLGVVFYLAKRMPYHHAIWHLLVLAGSVCHYFGVLAAVSHS